MLQDNIERIWERIEKACIRSGRRKDDVFLVAVTKNVPAEKVAQALQAGLRDIGENRVQEAEEKYAVLRPRFPEVRWNLIGHLQGNKVNRAAAIFDCIQSVDSEKLLASLDRRAGELEKDQECLVEIKVSEEPSKSGLDPEKADAFLDLAATLRHVRLRGVLAIAPYFADPEKARPYFRRARSFFEKNLKHFSPEKGAPLLSMGMSGDFEAAIEEGGNMVRIGTALFGARPKI